MKAIISICIAVAVFSTYSTMWGYMITRVIGDSAICKIAAVDDGDTFDLDCENTYYPNVRLLGVNTPDKDSKRNKEHCYYKEAKKYVESRIGRTYNVKFYGSDLCKDPYKGCRHLVQMIDGDSGIDMGKNMILKGMAFSWTNFSIIPDDIRNSYDTSESSAYEHSRGLWGKCDVGFYDDSGIDTPHPDKMTL